MSYNAQADSASQGQSARGLRVGLFALLVPVAAIVGLVSYVVSHTRPTGAENITQMPAAVALRIQKVGTVVVRDNATRVLRTGEQVFKGSCTACHTAGALGSPKFGDAAAWAPRIATGFDALLKSALKGKNAMPAQGGGEYADIEVARALVYMANAGGAKFAEPQAAAAPAASAPAVAK
jgi:cytochrome c5